MCRALPTMFRRVPRGKTGVRGCVTGSDASLTANADLSQRRERAGMDVFERRLLVLCALVRWAAPGLRQMRRQNIRSYYEI